MIDYFVLVCYVVIEGSAKLLVDRNYIDADIGMLCAKCEFLSKI